MGQCAYCHRLFVSGAELAISIWRSDNHRNPAKVSKVRAHLSKSQVMVVWLSVEWRRGEEIVDNIVWQVAERAVEDKELRENGENKQQLHST